MYSGTITSMLHPIIPGSTFFLHVFPLFTAHTILGLAAKIDVAILYPDSSQTCYNGGVNLHLFFTTHIYSPHTVHQTHIMCHTRRATIERYLLTAG